MSNTDDSVNFDSIRTEMSGANINVPTAFISNDDFTGLTDVNAISTIVNIEANCPKSAVIITATRTTIGAVIAKTTIPHLAAPSEVHKRVYTSIDKANRITDALESAEELRKVKLGFRHIELFLTFLSMMLFMMSRTCFLVITVIMLLEAPTYLNVTSEFHNTLALRWNPSATTFQLWMIFFWICSASVQLSFGVWSDRYGSKIIVFLCTVFNALISFSTAEIINYFGWQVFILLRIFQAMCESIVRPALLSFIARWLPAQETAFGCEILFGGAYFGVILGLSSSFGLFEFNFRWSTIFYWNGIFQIIFAVAWYILAANNPEEHWLVSEQEKQLIRKAHGSNFMMENRKKLIIPWKRILTSTPLLSLQVTYFSCSWAFWISIIIPLHYLYGVFEIRNLRLGFSCCIPFAVACLVIMVHCTSAYKSMGEEGRINLTLKRKVGFIISLWGQGMLFMILALLPPDSNLAVFLFSVIVIFSVYANCSLMVNPMDLTPNFTGTVTAYCTMLSSLAKYIMPLSIWWLITDETSADQWCTVFLIIAFLLFALNVFYIVAGSAEIQPWNVPKIMDS